jgi:hypothetical protein
MPGVIGVGHTPFLSRPALRRLAEKLKNSNSEPTIAVKPIFSARFSTRFSVWRGHSGCGLPSAVTKLPRKKGTPPSHGTVR